MAKVLETSNISHTQLHSRREKWLAVGTEGATLFSRFGKSRVSVASIKKRKTRPWIFGTSITLTLTTTLSRFSVFFMLLSRIITQLRAITTSRKPEISIYTTSRRFIMGRGKRKKNNWRGSGGKSNDNNTNNNNNNGKNNTTTNRIDGDEFVSKIIATGNYKMECYYAIQGIHNHYWKDVSTGGIDNNAQELVECITDEEKCTERNKWRNCIADVLPSSFRFAKDLPKVLLNNLIQQFHTLLNECITVTTTETETEVPSSLINENETITTTVESETTATTTTNGNRNRISNADKVLPTDINSIITKLPFISNGYQLQYDKTIIRKHPKLSKLHKWLIQQTDAGYITRQETVSMIPPVVLNCVPSDIVLDMCAAPGSKTSQVLEVLSENGILIANDNNHQRAYMLVHQLKRINNNNPVVVITSCDGQFFPSTNTSVKFTKIICDVPCTGDGTSRKNIGIWKNWTCVAAYSLHTLQYSIAWKGLSQLLHVGGYMVYSTCSLNPIENEAVVAELLRQSNGSVQLVNCQHVFNSSNTSTDNNDNTNNFRIRPGMTSWKVLIESKSRKQMKDYRNKNNIKMNDKRKVHDSNNNNTAGSDDNDIDDAENNTTNDVEDDNNDKEEGDDIIIDEYKIDQERMFYQKFEPTTFNDTTLMDMAINNSGLQYFTNYEQVTQCNQPHIIDRIKPSCFPPTLSKELEQFNLHYCVRCLPQDNNTGGFFVALLHKTAPISKNDYKYEQQQQKSVVTDNYINNATTTTINSNNDVTNEEPVEQPIKKARIEDDDIEVPVAVTKKNLMENTIGTTTNNNTTNNNITIGNDDCIPVPDDIMDPLINYYGLNTITFPRSQYMQRACASETKVIYYIAKSIKEKLIDTGFQQRITIIHTGLRGFTRNNRNNTDVEVKYRVCQEGVQYLLPHMTKRIYKVNENDFRLSLIQPHGKTMHLSIFSNSMYEQVKNVSAGSIVLVLDFTLPNTNDTNATTTVTDTTATVPVSVPVHVHVVDTSDIPTIAAVMWKCRGDSIDSLVAKVEIDGILSMLDAIRGIQPQQ